MARLLAHDLLARRLSKPRQGEAWCGDRTTPVMLRAPPLDANLGLTRTRTKRGQKGHERSGWHSVECETELDGTRERPGATRGRLPSNQPAGGGRGSRVGSGLMPPRSHQEVIWPDYMPSRGVRKIVTHKGSPSTEGFKSGPSHWMQA